MCEDKITKRVTNKNEKKLVEISYDARKFFRDRMQRQLLGNVSKNKI
jgi:hypothetical protein